MKYLGVQLDESLSGVTHAEHVMKTCSSRLAFLYRNSGLLDFNCRLTLCVALLQPYIDYCSSSWYSGLPAVLRNRLDVLQRKMIRFIFSMDFRQHVDYGDLRKLSWLSIPDRVSYFKLIHIFRIRHDLAPKYLSHNFRTISSSHQYHTRGSNFNYFMSKELSLAPHSFSCTAAKLSNSLPNELKQIRVLDVFKRKLKDFLLSEYA